MSESVSSDPIIRARGVVKRFGGVEVLRGIDLDLYRGEVVCVLGPSGSGKSTFLRCINHLERIDGGSLEVNGQHIGYDRRGDRLHELPERRIAPRRAQVGMVFQQFNLFRHMTALQNVMEAPVRVLRRSRVEAARTAHELLRTVGLAHRAQAYPSELSGGQQQRVAIARALAMEPAVMLFDEPTSALDPEMVGDVLRVMQDLAAGGMSMIVVTHEIGFARRAADRVVLMDDGLVVESGPPAVVIDAPETERARNFIRSVV